MKRSCVWLALAVSVGIAQQSPAAPVPVPPASDSAIADALRRMALLPREDGIPCAYGASPDQEIPSVEEDPNTLESWLRSLREKYPPPSPLDETD